MGLFHDIENNSNENPAAVLLNVCELTLAPEGEVSVIVCEVLDDEDEEEIFQ